MTTQNDIPTLTIDGQTTSAPDVSTFAVDDRAAACTNILSAVPFIKGTAEMFAFGGRSDYFKRWAYYFKGPDDQGKFDPKRGAWTHETDPTTRKPYASMRAWARLVFADAIARWEKQQAEKGRTGADGVKAVCNAIDYAADEGRTLEFTGKKEKNAKKNALEMLQQAHGLYLSKALTIDLVACEALLVQFQQAYNTAVVTAEQQAQQQPAGETFAPAA